jgi:hypothetical protein
LEHLKLALSILCLEELIHPYVLLRISDSAMDVVPRSKELICYMTGDEAIDTGDEEEGAVRDCGILDGCHDDW